MFFNLSGIYLEFIFWGKIFWEFFLNYFLENLSWNLFWIYFESFLNLFWIYFESISLNFPQYSFIFPQLSSSLLMSPQLSSSFLNFPHLFSIFLNLRDYAQILCLLLLTNWWEWATIEIYLCCYILYLQVIRSTASSKCSGVAWVSSSQCSASSRVTE